MKNVKIKKITSLILAAAMLLAIIPISVFAVGETLTTTIIDGKTFYKIYDAEDLREFVTMINASEDKNMNAILQANIVLNEIEFDSENPFNEPVNYNNLVPNIMIADIKGGIFDGNGYKITGLTKPLINGLHNNGVVKNLAVDDSYIDDENHIAAIVNDMDHGSITNCYVGDKVYFAHSRSQAGAICAYTQNGSITNSYSYANVTGAAGTALGWMRGSDSITITNVIGTVGQNDGFDTTYLYESAAEMIEANAVPENAVVIGGKVIPSIIASRMLNWDGKDGSAESTILLKVAPITEIDVDVPIALTFTIDSARAIHFPENVQVVSRSKTPLDVALRATSDDISLVAMNTFGDAQWDNLGMKDTHRYFAMKINSIAPPELISDGNGGLAFDIDDEEHEYEMLGTDVSAHDLGMLRFYDGVSTPSSLGLTFNAKYGKAWGNKENVKVNIKLLFTLSTPDQIEEG